MHRSGSPRAGPRWSAACLDGPAGAATLGIAYETGKISWREKISFRTVAKSELTSPTMAASALTVSVSCRTVTTALRARVNVAVPAKGIMRPLGRITVAYASASTSGTTSASLAYTDYGRHGFTLPPLRRRTCALTVTYAGTFLIRGNSVPAGTLTVR